MNIESVSYKVCSRCVMDTSDPGIVFDGAGVCNHCLEFESVTKKNWFPNEEGAARWTKVVEQIKAAGKGQEYDCILGLSGGVDSSYLAIKVKDWGLRPLVVHVDAGWNSELAVANIEALVKHCEYDLHTHVVDWEDMRDLHLAYLKAGISNQDVPQDHIFFASLYHFATKNGIKYILSGGNISTEGIFPRTWHGTAMDAINLKAIHRRYGERKLRNYKTISFFDYYFWYPIVKKMRTVRPLDFMPYDKGQALQELERTVGYKAYARKHGESQFTKLFQNYYLPTKFGFDKRLPHLSSLIVSGQMTRDEAVAKLAEPLYDLDELEIDIAYFCKKLKISRVQFDDFMKAPIHNYTDFPTWDARYRMLKAVQALVSKVTGKRIRVYS
ncbi:N-acetyl sugar amidotransferase [Pseudomonas auratipiscis]|uniref:N-acetyl sugar amidotransferase n=1 Tax=Pseudomonas auratipiscis TaxID=3115853 RepID=A0AB35WR32_9PSED|nr:MULTISPECIES: N-acetyl sugar amidotransferase [unclassified Pseudomonas]MEE1867161.1 N-acetyl sugar amidotransferase [Pseudomonas sp. 120P]MEE1957988.1 N-acetyl sugar amidotransferase [Pseudomonas sp. 119P]